MKLLRAILGLLLFVSAAGLFAGCATTDGDADNMSSTPWNQPQDWEGPLPSTINQGR